MSSTRITLRPARSTSTSSRICTRPRDSSASPYRLIAMKCGSSDSDGTHQIREEHRSALEHRDQHGLTPHVVPGDRAAELLHPAADVLAPEQDARDLRLTGGA